MKKIDFITLLTVYITTLIIMITLIFVPKDKEETVNVINTPIVFQTLKPSPTPCETEESTLYPVIESTPIVTIAPTIESTIAPTETPSPTPSSNITFDYFETNRLMYTVYGEDSRWGRRCASPHRESLVSIDEDILIEEVNGELITLHSIATNNDILPFNSIIYIPKLEKYFIVDDNADGSGKGIKNVQEYQTQNAWDLGCSIWIDIFCGLSTGYSESSPDWEKVTNLTKIPTGLGILEFRLIRYGK